MYPPPPNTHAHALAFNPQPSTLQALGITGAATHLVGRIPYFSIQPNLLTDVVQFSALGVGCAGAAVLLYEVR